MEQRQIAQFALEAELARGGQGVVYRARHQPSGRVVALKLLLEEDPKTRRRFAQEARVLTRLQHPSVLRAYDHGEHEGRPYLATELIEGDDLAALVHKGGVPEVAWSARVIASIAHALQHCHERGVVHRDLKPANVLVEASSGRPVLVDFGLVKRDAGQMAIESIDGGSVLSKTGQAMGTPEYMAPEQVSARSFGPITPRTDVYGLGATLYFLLTGRPPFKGGTSVVVMGHVTRKRPEDPSRANPGAPRGVVELCLRCLEKRPERRPASAAELAAALAQAAGIPDPVPPALEVAAARERQGGSGPPIVLPARPLQPGERAGPFVIEGELGRGAMGAVYRARRDDGITVALKVMSADALRSSSGAQRFARERRALELLAHPNVIRLAASGDGPPPWLAMELLGGGTLAEALARGPLAPDEAARVVSEVALGVAHAHRNGLAHRDLKPQNVLLHHEDGRAVVTDFGLVRDASEAERLTATGVAVGTLAYMAPEQLRGGPDVGPAADVWALGAILYRVLAGHEPFQSDSALAVAARISAGELVPLERAAPSVPPDLATVCRACLARDPAARPNALEVAYALRERRGLALAAGEGRSRAPLLASAAALLVLAAAAAAVALHAPPAPPRDPAPAAAAEAPQGPPVDPAAEGRAARERLDRIETPEARLAGAREWLARYREHPDAPAVEAVARVARLEVPLCAVALDGVTAATPCGDLLVVATRSSVHIVGDDGRERRRLDWGAAAAAAIDGTRCLLVGRGGLFVIDAATGATERTAFPMTVFVKDGVPSAVGGACAVTPAGSLAAITAPPQTVNLFGLPELEVLGPLGPFGATVQALAFSRDGELLAIGTGAGVTKLAAGADQATRVFELGSRKELLRRDSPAKVEALAFDAAGARLFVGTSDGELVVLDARTGEERGRAESADLPANGWSGRRPAHPAGVRGAALGAGGATLFTISGGTSRLDGVHAWELRLWDAATLQPIRSLARPRNLASLVRSADGARLALVAPDGVEVLDGTF